MSTLDEWLPERWKAAHPEPMLLAEVWLSDHLLKNGSIQTVLVGKRQSYCWPVPTVALAFEDWFDGI